MTQLKGTEEQWEEYLRIQYSGKTNMFALSTVVELSENLTKEVCLDIMQHYNEYEDEYGTIEHFPDSS